MPMQLQPVKDVLAEAGLQEPVFQALIADHNNYEVLLFQPKGDIEGDKTGVRHNNAKLADQQFSQFLSDAVACNADLAITPEYSLPWRVLIDAIKNGSLPAAGKLWALGCESINYAELQALKAELNPCAEILFETLVPQGNRFVDPLAYVFRTKDTQGGDRVVVLVQFKTCPMGDPGHFEIKYLQCGTTIYELGGIKNEAPLKLYTLICSDALAFTDAHAKDMYDRALIVHIQLNPSPRHVDFRRYRDLLLEYHGDATEILCLNWAANVVDWSAAKSVPWHNIGGSAWYVKAKDLATDDDTVQENHRRGLYYTWFDPKRSHVLYFNYQPATYLLTASKVEQIGVKGVLARSRGPQLTRTHVWDQTAATWVDQDAADDGFAAVVANSGTHNGAQGAITQVAQQSPLTAERLLALTTGELGKTNFWYTVTNLNSFQLPPTEEIQRITFCQDTAAQVFRVSMLQRTGLLWNHLQNQANLPSALKDLKNGFQFTWTQESPNQNVISDRQRPATVIYMGEGKTRAEAETLENRVSELLFLSLKDRNARHDAMQRLAVWYRDAASGALVLHNPNPHQAIDDAGEESPLDIGRTV